MNMYGCLFLWRTPVLLPNDDVNFLGDSDYVKICIDDLLIYSKTWLKHLDHVKEVRNRIKVSNLAINPEKSAFAEKEFEILGQCVSSNGVRTCNKPLKKINNLSTPKNTKEIQRHWGNLQWFRLYVNCMSIDLKPITDPLTGHGKFFWVKKNKLRLTKYQ